MKKAAIIVPVIILALSVHAQDVIILNSGDTLEAVVQKVGQPEIEYKRWDNQEGPVYTLRRYQVNRIIYANGTTDVFTETGVSNDTTAGIKENVWQEDYGDLTEVDLYKLGERHANEHYNAKRNFWAGYGCGFGYYFGWIGPLIIKGKPVKHHNLLYPNENLWNDPAYQIGYINEAQRKKKVKVWTGWAAGLATEIALIVAIALPIAQSQ